MHSCVYRVFTLPDTETDKKGCIGLCGDVSYSTQADTNTDSCWFCANLSVSVSVGVSVSASVSDSVNAPLLDWPVSSFYGQGFWLFISHSCCLLLKYETMMSGAFLRPMYENCEVYTSTFLETTPRSAQVLFLPLYQSYSRLKDTCINLLIVSYLHSAPSYLCSYSYYFYHVQI